MKWSSSDLVRVIERAGFRFARSGEHDVYVKAGYRYHVSIPRNEKDVPIGTVRKILCRQAGLTMAQAERMRDES